MYDCFFKTLPFLNTPILSSSVFLIIHKYSKSTVPSKSNSPSSYLLSRERSKEQVERGEEFVSGLIETYDDHVETNRREIERDREGEKKKEKCNYRTSEEWPPRTNGRGGGGAFWPDAPVLRVSLEIQGFDINAWAFCRWRGRTKRTTGQNFLRRSWTVQTTRQRVENLGHL